MTKQSGEAAEHEWSISQWNKTCVQRALQFIASIIWRLFLEPRKWSSPWSCELIISVCLAMAFWSAILLSEPQLQMSRPLVPSRFLLSSLSRLLGSEHGTAGRPLSLKCLQNKTSSASSTASTTSRTTYSRHLRHSRPFSTSLSRASKKTIEEQRSQYRSGVCATTLYLPLETC